MKGIINFGLLGIRRVFGGVMPPKPSIDKWVKEHMVFWYDMSKPVDVYVPGVTYANPFVNGGGKLTYDNAINKCIITHTPTNNNNIAFWQIKCLPLQSVDSYRIKVTGLPEGFTIKGRLGYDSIQITQDGEYDIKSYTNSSSTNTTYPEFYLAGDNVNDVDCNIVVEEIPTRQSVPTNEILKANPYLQDFSGNNRRLKLNNFLFAAMSGVGSYDLGYLCSNAHGKINPWARYKPVRYESLAPGENEKWWQGWDGNCGIMPKRISSYQDSVNWANGSMNGWEYTPPTGGKFPFRALDFDGYNHKARAPIGNFLVPSQATNQFTSSSFTASCTIMMPSEGSQLLDELNIGDISTVKDCYFGIYAKQRSGNQGRRVTAKNKIGSGYAMAEMITYGMPTGTWDVYPFLCTAILEQDAADVANNCYSIPLLSSKSIEIIASYVSITVLAGLLPSTAGNTTVTLRVRNSSSSTMTFKNNAWWTRFVNKNFNDSLILGEQTGKIADFDVPAGTTKEMEVTVSVSSQLVQAKNAKLWVSLNSASYIGSSIFMVAPDQ